MKIRQIIVLAVWMGFLLTTLATTEWSLYETDSNKAADICREFLYGNDFVNTFDIPDGYNGHFAAGKDYLYFTDIWLDPDYECGIVETTLEGDIVNEFTVTAPEELSGMIGYDGEYLWLSKYLLGDTLYCFTTNGDNGPYSPIYIENVYDIEALEGWNESICVIIFTPTIDYYYREYSRTGELLNEFSLPDPPSGGYGTYSALAIEPGIGGIIWTSCWDGYDGEGYVRKFTHNGDMVYESPYYWTNWDWAIGGSTVYENIQSTSLGRIKSLFAE